VWEKYQENMVAAKKKSKEKHLNGELFTMPINE
jgi:hypothetical protein